MPLCPIRTTRAGQQRRIIAQAVPFSRARLDNVQWAKKTATFRRRTIKFLSKPCSPARLSSPMAICIPSSRLFVISSSDSLGITSLLVQHESIYRSPCLADSIYFTTQSIALQLKFKEYYGSYYPVCHCYLPFQKLLQVRQPRPN